MKLSLGLNMRIFYIFLPLPHSIAMVGITQDMTASLEGVGSMPTVLPGL